MPGAGGESSPARKGRHGKAEKQKARAENLREYAASGRGARLEKLAAQDAPGNTGPPAAPTGERLIMIFTVCSP